MAPSRHVDLTVLCAESLSVLESDIQTVHPQLLGDAVSMPQISRLLEQIGVKRLTPTEMVHHHILPTLRSPNWQVNISVSSSSSLVAVCQHTPPQFDAILPGSVLTR